MEGKKIFQDLLTRVTKEFINLTKTDWSHLVARLLYYAKIWSKMTKNSFLVMLSQKKIFILFLLGKLMRFGLFLSFLYYLVKGSDTLVGFNIEQTIFFFLTFNIIDIVAQFLYREVYRFRPLLVSGDFDLVLTKPFSALFRALAGGADVIDMITIPPLVIAVVYVGIKLNPLPINIFYYVILVINGLLIATAFHIAVIAMGIITLEVDHTIMIYRDLTNLGRFPVDIYRQPLRGLLTYLIPVGIMITLPAKALMGMVSPLGVAISFTIGIAVVIISIKFWNIALRSYTSASS